MKRWFTTILLFPILACGALGAVIHSAFNAGYLLGAYFFDQWTE